MDTRHFASEQDILELHEARDGKPAFDAGRSRDFAGSSGGLGPAHPVIELQANPTVEGKERELETQAQTLRVVAGGAADELFTVRRGDGCYAR